MALISIQKISDDVLLGLWRIEETIEDFYSRYPFLQVYRKELEEKYKFEGRQKEFLSIRALLFEMTHDDNLRIEHLPSGKPTLKGWQLSISHTKGFAVLILSQTRPVAVDIEYLSERVNKIAHKFIRPDETVVDTMSRLVHWSVKETVYKYFSDEDLQYFEMRLRDITSDKCKVENLKTKKTVEAKFVINSSFVLSYLY